jgi:dihydroorotase-like cyclic amidohydrolase
MQTPKGTILKVNPPIRDPPRVIRMRALLKANKLDWIESDQADHAPWEKVFDPTNREKPILSGIPSMVGASAVLQKLVSDGILTIEQVRALVYDNPKEAVPKIRE